MRLLCVLIFLAPCVSYVVAVRASVDDNPDDDQFALTDQDERGRNVKTVEPTSGCVNQFYVTWLANTAGAATWGPVIAGHQVIATHGGSTVSAFNRTTGALSWNNTDGTVVGGAAFTHGRVIIARADSIVALNVETGVVEDTFELPEGSGVPCETGRPLILVSKKLIVFGTSSGRVFALRASNLGLRWSVDLGAHDGVSAPVSLWRRYVVVGTFSGNLLLLRKSDGYIYRSFTTPSVPRYSPGGFVSGITTRILIVDNIAYYSVNIAQNNFIAVRLDFMTLKWATTLSPGYSSFTSPRYSVDYNLVFTTTSDGKVFAVNPELGDVAWKFETDDGLNIRGRLAIVLNYVVFATNNGYIVGVNINTRESDFYFRYGTTEFNAIGRVTSDGTVFLAANGGVYPFRVSCDGNLTTSTTDTVDDEGEDSQEESERAPSDEEESEVAINQNVGFIPRGRRVETQHVIHHRDSRPARAHR